MRKERLEKIIACHPYSVEVTIETQQNILGYMPVIKGDRLITWAVMDPGEERSHGNYRPYKIPNLLNVRVVEEKRGSLRQSA